jgi:hypothetical protein
MPSKRAVPPRAGRAGSPDAGGRRILPNERSHSPVCRQQGHDLLIRAVVRGARERGGDSRLGTTDRIAIPILSISYTSCFERSRQEFDAHHLCLKNIDLFCRDGFPPRGGRYHPGMGGEIIVPMPTRCYDLPSLLLIYRLWPSYRRKASRRQ